jgi:exodeoxyribonuclease V alpha subunit
MVTGPHQPNKTAAPAQLTLDRSGPSSGEAGTPGPEGEVFLDGTVQRVLFHNPSTLWTVARFSSAPSTGASAEEITIVGLMPDLYEGAPLQVAGSWQENPRYGRQLRVRSCQAKLPETLIGLERYLGSKQFPRVGPELAKRMVEHFGHDTRAVLDREPGRLVEVKGIGRATAKSIAKAWEQQQEKREVKIFLHAYGVSDAFSERIYKRYGNRAMTLIRENPYRLALDIWGIGFRTADTIARNLGLEVTAPERLEAGLIHALGQLAEDGHVHAPELHLMEYAAKLLEVDIDLLGPALAALVGSQLVVREVLGDRGPCLSLAAMYESEHDAAAGLAELINTTMRPIKVKVADAIAAFEKEAGIDLARAQRRAIAAAIMDKCVVITGGPGVGKTTIVRAIVTILTSQHRSIALAAPTGRAAKRLSESTGMDAVTLHRLLEYNPRRNEFARNAENPLEVDVVIVDEVSMVDILLLRVLVNAIPPAAQLILVGDVDQLPSVGPGAVLADVIESRAVTVERLTEIFRQAAESRIITAAHQVNSGELPDLAPPAGSARADFYFISRHESDPDAARDTIVALVAERIPESFGLAPARDIQVLCPMHRGPLGTEALNKALQERLNPARSGGAEIGRGDEVFRAGDKVMQIKNDYDKSVFNGDIGVIEQIITGDETKLVVDFLDGRSAVYKRDELDRLTLAYAVSVHKSQGSEYPAVVMPLTTQHYMMLRRNLLYTGITRGKKLVVLVGSQKAMGIAIRNQSTTRRWTWLAERIRTAAGVE